MKNLWPTLGTPGRCDCRVCKGHLTRPSQASVCISLCPRKSQSGHCLVEFPFQGSWSLVKQTKHGRIRQSLGVPAASPLVVTWSMSEQSLPLMPCAICLNICSSYYSSASQWEKKKAWVLAITSSVFIIHTLKCTALTHTHIYTHITTHTHKAHIHTSYRYTCICTYI